MMTMKDYLKSFDLQTLNEIFEMMERDYDILPQYTNREEAIEQLFDVLESNPDAFHDCVPAPMD